jgi:hypothetical protein
LLIGSETIYCHEIVMKNNSYLKEAFKENKKENYEQFGKNLTKQQLYLPNWMKPRAVW